MSSTVMNVPHVSRRVDCFHFDNLYNNDICNSQCDSRCYTHVNRTGVVNDRIVRYFEIEEFADGGYRFRNCPPFGFDVGGLVRGRQAQQKRDGGETLHLGTRTETTEWRQWRKQMPSGRS